MQGHYTKEACPFQSVRVTNIQERWEGLQSEGGEKERERKKKDKAREIRNVRIEPGRFKVKYRQQKEDRVVQGHILQRNCRELRLEKRPLDLLIKKSLCDYAERFL